LPMNLAKHDVFSVEKSINHSLLVIHSAKWSPRHPWWSAKTITIFGPSGPERGANSINWVNNGVNI
jgi:hypothetical protein